MRRLGLIGGLAVGATVHYYRELARLGAGEMVFIHADLPRVMGDVQRGDHVALAAYFSRLIDRLAAAGAEIVAISAVTPHICIRELEQVSALPVIDIVQEVKNELYARRIRRVALFGTKFVVESRMFGMLEGIDVMLPDQIEEIHDAYMRIVNGDQDARLKLMTIAHDLPVDAVVLAGTDLSPVFHENITDFPFVDCSNAHLAGILREIRSG